VGSYIQSEHDDQYHIPHQGLWFILFLTVMLLLLSKNVATHLRPAGDGGQATMHDQCVIA
jgi:hypothetical protein